LDGCSASGFGVGWGGVGLKTFRVHVGWRRAVDLVGVGLDVDGYRQVAPEVAVGGGLHGFSEVGDEVGYVPRPRARWLVPILV